MGSAYPTRPFSRATVRGCAGFGFARYSASSGAIQGFGALRGLRSLWLVRPTRTSSVLRADAILGASSRHTRMACSGPSARPWRSAA
jgi:hypothetical protein